MSFSIEVLPIQPTTNSRVMKLYDSTLLDELRSSNSVRTRRIGLGQRFLFIIIILFFLFFHRDLGLGGYKHLQWNESLFLIRPY